MVLLKLFCCIIIIVIIIITENTRHCYGTQRSKLIIRRRYEGFFISLYSYCIAVGIKCSVQKYMFFFFLKCDRLVLLPNTIGQSDNQMDSLLSYSLPPSTMYTYEHISPINAANIRTTLPNPRLYTTATKQ